MRLVAQYDSELCEHEWEFEYFLEIINEHFSKVFPKKEVAMIAKNHGWRKLNGYRTPEHFKNGSNALGKVMGGTAPSMKVYVAKNSEYGYHIAVNTAHHDSPMWDEWTYLIRPKYFNK